MFVILKDETVWDVADTKQQIDSKSDITLEPLTIYVNSADQNPEGELN